MAGLSLEDEEDDIKMSTNINIKTSQKFKTSSASRAQCVDDSMGHTRSTVTIPTTIIPPTGGEGNGPGAAPTSPLSTTPPPAWDPP